MNLMEDKVALFLINILLSYYVPEIFSWFKKNWGDDKKAFNYARKKLEPKYKNIIPGQNFNDGIIHKFYLTAKDIHSIPLTTSNINLRLQLIKLLKQRTSDWIENRNEETLKNMINDFIDRIFEYHIKEADGVAIKYLQSLVMQNLNMFLSNQKIKILQPLHSYLSNQGEIDSFKNIIDNDLLYFTENENNIIYNSCEVLKGFSKRKNVLITGQPAIGKTFIAYKIGLDLLKAGFKVYILNLNDPLPDFWRLWDELELLEEKTLVIFDNCHDRVDILVNICKRCYSLSKLSFLFIFRDLPTNYFNIDEYDDFNILDYFNNAYYKILDKDFDEKAKGIINKFKLYLENLNSKNYEIGNQEFIIHNVKKNLVALSYNLRLWEDNIPLQKVDKKLVFDQLLSKYFKNEKDTSFILILASLSKYEIYLDASEQYIDEASKFCSKGFAKNFRNSNYYYLYHSSFANLLLNAYTIHSEYNKYKDENDLVFNKIKEYIFSFKKYPQNLDNVFFNLISNHGLEIAYRLLKEDTIGSTFIGFYNNNRINFQPFLLLLHRLDSIKGNDIAERLSNDINNEVWIKNLNELKFPSFTICLYHLFKNNPDKAFSILNSFYIEDLVEKAQKTTFYLLTNSIRELEKISGKYRLGNEILKKIPRILLENKIRESSIIHFGKGLSELYATNPQMAEELLTNIEPTIISTLIRKANFKSYSKALNELNKIQPQLANLFFVNTSVDELINQLENFRIEGISRSLSELSKINLNRTSEIFSKIENEKIINLLYNSSFIQIALSISELNNINKSDDSIKKRILEIFYALENDKLIKMIQHKSVHFHQIGGAFLILNNLDYQGYKIQSIIEYIDRPNLLSKAKKCSFHKLCLGISDFHNCNLTNINSYIIENFTKEEILLKAKKERIEYLGSDLNKISKADKKLSDYLLSKINWNKIIKLNRNVKFTNLVDSITALSNYNKLFASSLLGDMELEWLVKRASLINKKALMDSFNKLSTVNKKRTSEIVIGLKKIHYLQ
jgi:hypothetical protein